MYETVDAGGKLVRIVGCASKLVAPVPSPAMPRSIEAGLPTQHWMLAPNTRLGRPSHRPSMPRSIEAARPPHRWILRGNTPACSQH